MKHAHLFFMFSEKKIKLLGRNINFKLIHHIM